MKKSCLNRSKFLGFAAALLALTICSSPTLAEDRLVIKDGSGNTVFSVIDDGKMSIIRTSYPVIQGERQTTVVNDTRSVANFIHSTSGDMVDGFGPEFAFSAKDNSGVEYALCTVGAARDGSDNSGAYVVMPRLNGAKYTAMKVAADGALIMASGATCTAAGNWEDGSSRELKKDIRELTSEEAMNTLKQMEPVEFKYKRDDSDTHLGFIAEDVPAVIASKDRRHMSSMDVAALLTKVVQEQQAMIEKLSAEIDALKK
ncbi:MAG: tail fiber domain-containing protein [Deltaproteobacteria bacterium]|nr:tail fiber domain-containing protein [Deltaproteobacteria bacterium]